MKTLVVGRGSLGSALSAALPAELIGRNDVYDAAVKYDGFVYASGLHDLGGHNFRAIQESLVYQPYGFAKGELEDGCTHVVFMGSLATHQVLSASPGYVAGHHGLLGVMRSLAVEYAGKASVNMVCPGNIDGGMKGTRPGELGQTADGRGERKIASRTLDRWIKVEEVVEAVRFLLGCSLACTGNALRIDGARSWSAQY